MFVDLHAHYPMHLPLAGNNDPLALIRTVRRAGWWEAMSGLLLKIANNVGNYPKPGEPAVTMANLKAGGVAIVLSALYIPYDEIDLRKRYGARPQRGYFADLRRQLDTVEENIAAHFAGDAAVVHNRGELAEALAARRVALIHAVEGGFHIGDTVERVRQNMRALARWGVGYVTIAHLFWRQLATNAPALPFLPDWGYRWLFPQPPVGLTELGRAVIEAMVEERVLIDVTHMSQRALQATFSLLDRIDPERAVPVIATHSAYRFGRRNYNLVEPYIGEIASRQGVIGLTFCQHYMTDGIRKRTRTFEQSMDVICRHIDQLHQLTGSHAYTALGSDWDGFIKPTLAGLEDPSTLPRVWDFFSRRYGAENARQICSGNAQRVLAYRFGRIVGQQRRA